MPHHSVKSVVFEIPLHRTPIEDSDADALLAALRSGMLTGDGHVSTFFSKAEYTAAEKRQ